MINKITNTIGGVNKTQKTIKILTFPTHEGYAYNLGFIPGVEFHVYHIRDNKKWDFQTRGLPQNHFLYTADVGMLRDDVTFDFILSQERQVQLSISKNLQQQLQIPIISLTHTEPYPGLKGEALKRLQRHRGDINLYITEHNKASWNDETGIVIPHGINENIFCPNSIKSLESQAFKGVVIANHFEKRDVFLGYNIFREVIKNDQIEVIGDNPGTPFHRNINDPHELVKTLNTYSYYANFTQLSPLPLSLLEAAMCGLPIITTPKQQIPSVFTHGVNALFAETPKEFREQIAFLKDRHFERQKLGESARKLMIEKFSINQFIQNWNRILTK